MNEERGSGTFSAGDAREIMNRIFAVTEHDAVWGHPIERDGYTVMTASEIVAGGGFGFGSGRGPAASGDAGSAAGESAGAGGGGGGGASARPVAVVLVGPDGVRVKPVVDVTKLAIAALTAWGLMLPMILKSKRR
jgi:uncharacterized spore protein YtfJ